MNVARPDTLADALAVKAANPDAVAITGGTDVMVALNFDRLRPSQLLDLSGVAELRGWERDGTRVRLGAGLTYTRIVRELRVELPGLAMASRTVGSPQIRNRGTVAGNVATASPAGDALPLLYAGDAEIELASVDGSRCVPVQALLTGPKRAALRPEELITAIHVPVADGPQQFAKVGPRNAMVIAVCSLGLSLSPERHTVAVCVGSAGPTPLRAPLAERFAAQAIAEVDGWASPGRLSDTMLARFGTLVGEAARPISDVRSSAAYRRRALEVLARRTLAWAWEEHRRVSASACA